MLYAYNIPQKTGAVVCYGSYAGRDAWIGGRL